MSEKIEFINADIGINEVNKLIEVTNTAIENGMLLIEINCQLKINAIDQLFFAYLLLLKQKFKLINYIIRIPKNTEKDDLFYQITHQLTYSYLVTSEQIANIIYGQNEINIIYNNEFTSLVSSEKIFPIFLIDGTLNNFDFFFTTSLNNLFSENQKLDILNSDLKWNSSSNDLSKKYSEYYINKSLPKNKIECFLNLARIQFVKSLNNAKVAQFYFEEEYDIYTFTSEQRIQAGSLRNENAFEYYKRIKFIFDELSNSSIFQVFLFNSILATELIEEELTGKNTLTADNKEEFVTKIISLWNYTKQIFIGIKELAKNIREHTYRTDGSKLSNGAISIRTFDFSKWQELKGANNPFDNQGLSSILEIYAIDLGDKGILETLYLNTMNSISETKNDNLKEILQGDLLAIEDANFSFGNLLDNTKNQLIQQSKRSIAHFGLLTLSKLIVENKGLIISSTSKIPNLRDLAIMPLNKGYIPKPVLFGTNFNITIPIKANTSLENQIPQKISLPVETTAKDLKGIEELLNYAIISKTGESEDPGSINIYIVNEQSISISNRDEELIYWKKIESIVNKKISEYEKLIICIDLSDVIINDSQLFRLLGQYELNYPNLPLIISKISNDVFNKMLELNKIFNSNKNANIPFWNENIATLVYSYINIEDECFFLTDILWGNTQNDFVKINWLGSQSTFNSVTLLNQLSDSFQKIINNDKKLINPNTPLLFYNNLFPLPFELILKDSKNNSFFESNISIILKNDLSAN